MKLLTSLSIAAATLALSVPVFSQSASKNVNVNATLTDACVFNDATVVTLNANYAAFGPEVNVPSSPIGVQCTRGTTPPKVSFDGAAAGPAVGTVGGLAFEVTAAFTPGLNGSPPTGTDINDLGSAKTGSFVVNARFPAGQAGTTGTNTAVTKVMTLTF